MSLILGKPLIVKQQNSKTDRLNSDISVFRDKPFWIWDSEEHRIAYSQSNGTCCFNHIIGLPEKDHLIGKNTLPDGTVQYITENKVHPLYDFQKEILDALENFRYIFLLKATGLGATEILLRWICWKALKDDTYKGRQAVIVTGPAQELALKFIQRIERFFQHDDYLKKCSYQPVAVGEHIIVNEVLIQAYPSHNFKRARGLDKAFFFLVDEFDFFPPGNQRDARTIPERYIGKSSPYIALVTTPDTPDSLADQLKKEPETTCRYRRLYMNYEVGLGKIYTPFEIEEAKQTGDFEREYNLSFTSGNGNIFSKQLLDLVVQDYPLAYQSGKVVISVDPAYGSSKFAIVICEQINGIIYVREAEQFERPSPDAMIKRLKMYYDQFGTRAKILVDMARPEISDGLQRDGYPSTRIDFKKDLSVMTFRTVQAVRNQKVRIHSSFKDLIGQLRAVESDDRGYPNKKKLTFDEGDAFLMNISSFNSGEVTFIDLGK